MLQRRAKDSTKSSHNRIAEKPTLETLFKEEESSFLGFAYSIVRQREIAEELIQDVFCRLHQHWPEVDNPRAWAYRALRNLCISWLRKHQRETNLEDEYSQVTDSQALTPDEIISKFEATEMTRLFLAELEDKDRELVDLKYLEGFSYTQIAERTGLSVGNVGYRLHHILRGLATSLRSVGVTGSSR